MSSRSWSSSLLYEGYALYPYTPGATKNATPTPFGIVYPPAYAAECAGAFDHARLECLAEPARGATLAATLRYLAPERRAPSGARAAGRARPGGDRRAGQRRVRRRAVHAALRAEAGTGSLVRSLRPQHRARCLRASIAPRALRPLADLDPHRPPGRQPGASSPRSRPAARASTSGRCWRRPATTRPRRGDRAPRPPAARPGEPRQPVRQHRDRGGAGPARARADRRRARAAAASRTGRPGRCSSGRWPPRPRRSSACTAACRSPRWRARPRAPAPARAAPTTPARSARRSTASRSSAAATLVLRPGTDRDSYDRMLDGRQATLERIYVDYDDRVHLGGDGRRRPRPGADARDRALPVLLRPRGGAAMTETARTHPADPGRRHRQRLAARRRLRRRGGQAAGRARAARRASA